MGTQINEQLLAQIGDTTMSVLERAKLTRQFIWEYPSYRPLPIDLDVVKAIKNEYDHEWAFGAANRMNEATKNEALIFAIGTRPADAKGDSALTQALIGLNRYEEALHSMVDEYNTYAKMPFPLDMMLLSAWGTHLVQSCETMGWNYYERFRKTTLTIKVDFPTLLKSAFIKAVVKGKQKEFRDSVIQQWDAVWLKLMGEIAKEKGLV